MKRILDILAVLLSAPLWLPILAVAAFLVLLFMGRPVFFAQSRIGLRNRPFTMLKLRTMRPGPGPDSSRTTRLGKFLRTSSIDELPELFHVLSGKMSIVGPRPLPARYLPRYSPSQLRRHEVRPGVTGWAQINGRNFISWSDKFACDVWYVDHRSLALDLKIIALTFLAVLRPSGINAQNGEAMPEFLGDSAPNPISNPNRKEQSHA